MKARILLIVGLMIFVMSSCRKYEEGPNLSLRSAKARATNSWAMESITINGIEKSDEPGYTNQRHYMFGDGQYTLTVIDPVTLIAENIQGNWELYDSDRKMALTLKNFTGNIDSVEDYKVLKLFKKQMWLRSIDNVKEIHFIPFNTIGDE